ncbi:MAG TPA: hypothetical protein VGC88_01810 [Terriglobales bacterium]
MRPIHGQKVLSVARWAGASLLLLAAVSAASHQEARVNAGTEKIELDNSSVVVRRNIHPPATVTPLHSHGAGVVVYISDVHERSYATDGSSREIFHKAGDVIWNNARTHRLENLGDKPIEAIEIELKHP